MVLDPQRIVDPDYRTASAAAIQRAANQAAIAFGLPRVGGSAYHYQGQVGSAIVAAGDSSPLTGTFETGTISTNQNDYALPPGAGWLQAEPSSAIDWTGFSGGAEGRVLRLTNTGTATLTLRHQSSSSSAANRIITPDGLSYAVAAGESAVLIYDAEDQRWRVQDRTTSGGMGAQHSWYFRHVGTTPKELWYRAGRTGNAGTVTNSALTANTLYALPFFAARGGTWDRIGFEVATAGAAGDNAICGVYTTTSATSHYPDARVVLGDDEDVSSTGLKTSTISYSPTAGALLWVVFTTESASPIFKCMGGTSFYPINGLEVSGGVFSAYEGVGWKVARVYDGTLPATFPAGADVMLANETALPIVALRYSA